MSIDIVPQRTEFVEKMILCPYDADERDWAARRLAEACLRKAHLDGEARRIESERDNLADEIANLAYCIDLGGESKPVNVRREWDFVNNSIREYDTRDGKVLMIRAMNRDEANRCGFEVWEANSGN